MKVGLTFQFQARKDASDAEMFAQELELAVNAEALGFDRVMSVEHHFTDYAMCPDNSQFLSYVAAKTSRVELFPAAFILPWWKDPIRVAEKAVLLDYLSGGRAVLGMGRGLARREFESFGIDMSESRDRFDEAAEMILEALETGFMEGDGEYYKQKRTEIRPRTLKSFKDRSFMVGGSPSSLVTAARLGLAVMQFGTAPTQDALDVFDGYRRAFRDFHGAEAPPLLTADLLLCDRDAGRAEELARKHMVDAWYAVMDHYEMLSQHFEQQNGTYDMYAEWSERLRNDKDDAMAHAYVDANLWGDPAQIIEKVRAKYEMFGGIELALLASYADLPYDVVRNSIHLFAEEVLPELHSWPATPVRTESLQH